MVYESDFYSTRRVGSSYTRPTISSYTVTVSAPFAPGCVSLTRPDPRSGSSTRSNQPFLFPAPVPEWVAVLLPQNEDPIPARKTNPRSCRRRGVDWDKVPFVPRPSLIPDPVTTYGKRQPRKQAHVSILEAINREGIEPDPRILARPIEDYRSPRDINRERIANELHRREYNRATGHTTDADNVDTLLRRVHGTAPVKEGRRHTPRYTTVETSTPRRDESYTYSKTYKTVTESSNASDPYSSRPSTSSSSYSSTTERNSRGGPGGYSYSTERTSTTGGGPGGYSYSSTTSGRLPHGTTYRHYSYRTPLRYSGVPRFNTITTTTMTYRTPMPYVAHKRLVPVTRVVTSPPRVMVSPLRVLGSPVRVISSPVRVISSPVRVFGSPVRTVRAIRSPARVIVSPARVVTIRSSYLRPSIINKEFDRIERKYRASPEFEDEKRDIRNSTALLLRQLNDPVPRLMAPSAPAAPEPNTKKWVYDPFSTHNRLNSDTYVKSHITDPIRSVRNDIEAMARYHSPASRYVGKNHLASTRIIGSQAYPKSKPRIYNYDTARVGKDVNVMSYYKSNRTQAKADVEEVNTKIKKYLEKYYLNHAYKVPDEFKEFLHEYP
uniref:Uncharacterized protein n=1 Tax=Anopheles dirus TaxID=7168 RepID=A0A182NA93_9DIPT